MNKRLDKRKTAKGVIEVISKTFDKPIKASNLLQYRFAAKTMEEEPTNELL